MLRYKSLLKIFCVVYALFGVPSENRRFSFWCIVGVAHLSLIYFLLIRELSLMMAHSPFRVWMFPERMRCRRRLSQFGPDVSGKGCASLPAFPAYLLSFAPGYSAVSNPIALGLRCHSWNLAKFLSNYSKEMPSSVPKLKVQGVPNVSHPLEI